MLKLNVFVYFLGKTFETNQNIDCIIASFGRIFGNLETCGVEIGLKIFRKGRILKILIIFGDFEFN